MLFTEGKVQKLKEINHKWNKAIALYATISVFPIIGALVFAYYGESEIFEGLLIPLGVLLVVGLSALIGACIERRTELLNIAGLKRHQFIYSVNYYQLNTAIDRVSHIDPNGGKYMIITEGCEPILGHERFYLDERNAQDALDRFLEGLYSDVKSYIGCDGSIPVSVMGEIRQGFMNYIAKNSLVDPTKYDISKVVIEIEEYHKSKASDLREQKEAKESLKRRIISE